METTLNDILEFHFGSGFPRPEAPTCESYTELIDLLNEVGELVEVDVNEIVKRLDDFAKENALRDGDGNLITDDAEIDRRLSLITDEDVVIEGDMLPTESGWNVYLQTWFDVDKRFGISTFYKGDSVDVYAYYNPSTLRFRVTYIVKFADGTQSDETDVDDLEYSETSCIIRLMQEKCHEDYDDLSLNDAWIRCKDENDGASSEPSNGNDFCGDDEKMEDFFTLSKAEFLLSYRYLRKSDYAATLRAVCKHPKWKHRALSKKKAGGHDGGSPRVY